MINKKRLVRLTKKLISINSENPPGNERALADFVACQLRSLGLTARRYTFKKNRPNIVATFKGSLPRAIAARRALLLSPHLDTVPAGTGWTVNPFGGTVRKGRIYGRGATDDKGNLACALEALHSLIEDGFRPAKDIIMAATADEETGSRYGIIPLLEKGILKPKAALILDSAEFDTVVAQKGLVHCRMQIFGTRAHGAYNWRGVNAIEAAARIITQLKKHRFAYARHPLMRGPTINVGTITGGDKVNIVADFCECALDIRFLPGMKHATIIKEVKSIMRAQAKNFQLVIDNIQQPYQMDARHPFVRAYTQAARKMGFRAPLKGSEGATVITFFQNKGIPALATGFGAHGTAHTTDEYATVKTLYNGARVLERFIQEYDRL